MLGKVFRVVVISLTLATTVQAQVQDTILKKSTLLTGKDALLLASFALGTALVAPIDMQIASRLQDPRAQENRFLKTAATGFRLLADPGSFATGAGIYLIGRLDGQRRVQALGLHSVESILLADILGGWSLAKLNGTGVLLDPALAQNDDAVCQQKGFVQVVRHQHGGDSQLPPNSVEGNLKVSAGNGVEGAEGLVKQDHIGTGCQCAGHGDPLPLPAG